MKKILALTLALMLALSLTAALAATGVEGHNTVDLQVNVDTQTVNNVTVGEAWNVDITADNLTWNLNQKVTLTGSVSEWNPSTGKYNDGDGVERRYETTPAENGGTTKQITITNNSNFDVRFQCTLSPSSAAFAEALHLPGDSSGTLVNKAGNANSVDVYVDLDPGAPSLSLSPISTGSAGSVEIMLTKGSDLYPYEP